MKPIIFVKFSTVASAEEISKIMNGMNQANPEVSFIGVCDDIALTCLIPEGYKIEAVEFTPSTTELQYLANKLNKNNKPFMFR